MEPRHPDAQVTLPSAGLDERWLLGGLLPSLVRLGADEREYRLTGRAVDVLTGRA